MKTLQERFDEKWRLDPVTGCWLWTAYVTPTGYGTIHAWGRNTGAHRVSYWLHNRGMSSAWAKSEVMHSCANLHCVNPGHLFIGSDHRNTEWRSKSGRPHQRGSESPNTDLKESDVREMRVMFVGGHTHDSIALRFGIHRETARQAIHGITWKHVDGAVALPERASRINRESVVSGTTPLTRCSPMGGPE